MPIFCAQIKFKLYVVHMSEINYLIVYIFLNLLAKFAQKLRGTNVKVLFHTSILCQVSTSFDNLERDDLRFSLKLMCVRMYLEF